MVELLQILDGVQLAADALLDVLLLAVAVFRGIVKQILALFQPDEGFW